MIGHAISAPIIRSTDKGRNCDHHKTKFSSCDCSAIEHLVEAAQIVRNLALIAERMMSIRGHNEFCSKTMYCSCGAKGELDTALHDWESITSTADWWMNRFNNVMRVEEVCQKLDGF